MMKLVVLGALSLSATSALVVQSQLRAPPAIRAGRVALCAGPEAEIKDAAARVVTAAGQFGESQGAAAARWVEDAMNAGGGGAEAASKLLEEQLEFFEECLVEESFLCEELDAALSALEKKLAAYEGPAEAFKGGLVVKSKVDRAEARVRTAAAKFGEEQERIASLWVAEMRKDRSLNPFMLLEQQLALFGECMLDDDGGSERCQELHDSLAALQLSLGVRGMITPTGGLSRTPK